MNFVPPGTERADEIRSSVLIAVRLIRAMGSLLLTEGKTAMFLILRTTEESRRECKRG
jgi:hypothetical protein